MADTCQRELLSIENTTWQKSKQGSSKAIEFEKKDNLYY
jgi:hypothetical protein